MAITITEESSADLPIESVQGTEKRRKIVFLRITNTTTADTYDISSTVEPNSADIEGIFMATVSSIATTEPTWSTNTITFSTGIGAWELGLICNLT